MKKIFDIIIGIICVLIGAFHVINGTLAMKAFGVVTIIIGLVSIYLVVFKPSKPT